MSWSLSDHSCLFPPLLGGTHTRNFPHNRKSVPPKCPPPRLGGNRGSPPLAQIWRGSPCIFGGEPLIFCVPPKFGGDAIMGKCKFPPKCDQFWRGRDTFSPANLQTCKKCRLGGNSTKLSPPQHPKFPPQLGGTSPPKFPPTFLKKTRFACDFFSVSPPIGGDKQLCIDDCSK